LRALPAKPPHPYPLSREIPMNPNLLYKDIAIKMKKRTSEFLGEVLFFTVCLSVSLHS
jgi:hypothetical protein